MQLYADENFPLDVVKELRNLGHDVITALEDGKANLLIPDERVLERAIELGRVLLTLNRKDFKKLHNQNPNHSGIVICTEDIDFTGQAERIDKALKDRGEIKEQLIRVYRPSN
jgi:predicted nuclease of predicted toxin-antitoxin system